MVKFSKLNIHNSNNFFEKKPIAIFIKEKKKFYITKNGDLIKFKNLDIYIDFPILFGNKNNLNYEKN